MQINYLLNISKMKSMLFCRSPPPENEELILTMSNTIIQRMKCLQFLGLYIDEKLDWHEHINKCKMHPLFTCLKLVKLNDVYKLEIGKFMYNYVHRSLPYYLSDIFTFTHDIHIHKTRQSSHIRPFTSLTVKFSNSFLCKGPLIWNINSVYHPTKNNIKSFAVSLKAIVLKGYEELAEAY